MNLRKLLKHAGVSNDIIKEVERKAKKTSEQMELEHQERALAMTKMMVNEALRARKSSEDNKPPFPQKTIIIPD